MIFSFSFCERIGLSGGNNTQAFVSGFLNWKNENTNVVTLMQCSLTLTGWCHHKHKTLYRYLANGVIFHTLLSFPNIASIFSAPALAVWKSLLRQRYHSPWRPVVGCSSAFFGPLSPQEDIPQSLWPLPVWHQTYSYFLATVTWLVLISYPAELTWVAGYMPRQNTLKLSFVLTFQRYS